MNLKEFLKAIRLNESTISMILGALVVLVVGILIVNYFRGLREGAVTQQALQETSQAPKLVEEEGKLIPEALPATHTLVAGEHLWSIAQKYYGSGYNWVDIAKENNLANPNRVLAGQTLNIPRVAVRQPAATTISAETQFGPKIESNTYTVVKGDYLWGIAVRAYGDGYQWVKIARENNLSNPNLVHPGNVLTIPR